ncbi:hypothetical protein C1H46_030158 [Malus baccata]|uniref:Uncharacterized protein n=1 Tax=Malus baccata TaxID=106549 RepID=A0A540LDD5_MALBA|nr:hypothetical protein C1H46_030158 [Malus baccata]
MTMRRFYNEIKGLKLQVLPNHNKLMLFVHFTKKNLQKGLDNYQAKYIQTSFVDPLLHVWFGGTIFSCLVALPEKRCHIKHAKEHGHCPRSYKWYIPSIFQFFFLFSAFLLNFMGKEFGWSKKKNMEFVC